MIPGNVDPRRPDKVQRYKAPQNNGNAPGEDLTPDYMNILGPESTTANAATGDRNDETANIANPNVELRDDGPRIKDSNASTNVIPTSPQYGVAIIPTTSADVTVEIITSPVENINETMSKATETDNKDMHSTPSRNDRFKVVKIASSEPFRRGRWKCMDYVDQVPPTVTQLNKAPQVGNVYLQTQSLPQQQIQQMLVQSGVTAPSPQMYQNMQQMIPQGYYYSSMQNQNVQQLPVLNMVQNSVPPQFINASQQPYFQPMVVSNSMPPNFQNVQFVQPNLVQNQAFVSPPQNMNNLPQNFQQSQTYAGQSNRTDGSQMGNQPMVNGYNYPQSMTDQQILANSLPTQVAKTVILNQTNPPQNQQMEHVNQGFVNQVQQNQAHEQMLQQNMVQMSQQAQVQDSKSSHDDILHNQNQVQVQNVQLQNPNDPNMANVYTNPQFVASVNSIPDDNRVSEANDPGVAEVPPPSAEDPAKTIPVVNAIDNKIEQAMDLVKSHLMYTVREEVEVLKEKISELMERIQQLETENNFLRGQIPKNSDPNGPHEQPQ